MVCPNIWIDFDFDCFALMLRALISCNIVVCPNLRFGWFALCTRFVQALSPSVHQIDNLTHHLPKRTCSISIFLISVEVLPFFEQKSHTVMLFETDGKTNAA